MSEQPIQKKRRTRRRLLFGLFLLFIVAVLTGVFIFKQVLRPGQQQRVINILPFMEVFLQRPSVDTSLPTALPATNEISPEDLLKVTLSLPTSQPEATASPTNHIPLNTTKPAQETPRP